MKIRKKKGFTLIELMIVLAIIAILAVVLIPKSGIFKSQAKNSGVTTNVNTVRAYLETKVTNSNGNDNYLNASNLATTVANSFGLTSSGSGPYTLTPKPSGSGVDTNQQIINPFNGTDKSIIISDNSDPGSSDITTGEVVIVVTHNGDTASGVVNGYRIYGVDNGNNKIQEVSVK